MKKKRSNIQKDILFIFISSFLVVVAWIGFNLYHIWATSSVSQDVQMQLTPIDPEFDQITIQKLKTRESIEPLYIIQKNTSAGTPTAAPTPGPLDASLQSETVASSASRLAPANSQINRAGQ